MKIDPYIRSLDDDKRADITNAVSQSVDLVDFNMTQLIAWMTAYLRIYAVVLFTCCGIICALFVTNRLIIRWNHEHDHPHGRHPYYLMFTNLEERKKLRSKLKVINLFKDSLKFMKNDDYRDVSLLRSISKGVKRGARPLLRTLTNGARGVSALLRRVKKNSILPEEQHYPEVVKLRVTRDSPSTPLGIQIGVFDNDNVTRVAVTEIQDGPLYRSGLMQNDIFLTVDNLNIHTSDDLSYAIEEKTEMEFVVKRMSRSRGEGCRGNKIHTFDVTISRQLGLGLNLKLIKSDYENEEAHTFLYVSELREYPNGDAGPGLVAGIRQYDLILKMNGVDIHTVADVKGVVEGEETVQCQVRRMIHHFKAYDENESSDEIVVIERAAGESLGLSLSESYDGDSIDPFLIVTKVREGGAGFRAGVEIHDIIVKIDDEDVNDLNDLKARIAGAERIELTVRRASA